MKYELPKLEYGFDALEPYIDARTMEIHYTKHHQGYVDKLNAVLEKYPELAERNLEDLIKNAADLPMTESDRLALLHNGGGHLNHSLFWQTISPEKKTDESLKSEIEKKFGSVEEFKKQFSQAASSHFASGWTWLVRDENGEPAVYSLPNHESPIAKNHKPIAVLDVWEHAYYLKYQNRRPEYIENWWNVFKFF